MKVHFAGMELFDSALVLNKFVGIRYGLFTVFPFIAEKQGIKALRYSKTPEKHIRFLNSGFKHMIMDSGLFTLMFGAHAGKRDFKFLSIWLDNLIQFVHEFSYSGTVVEVDCQKILGIKSAWKLRQRLRSEISNEIINVYHSEDKKKGLERLIESSNYIAISVPELREMKIPNLADYIQRQAYFIKNKKPDIKIHLLGCTQLNIMEKTKFCDSCDSTSWQKVNRFGSADIFRTGKSLKKVKRSHVEEHRDLFNGDIDKLFNQFGVDPVAKDTTYYSNHAITSHYLKLKYQHYAGNQD